MAFPLPLISPTADSHSSSPTRQVGQSTPPFVLHTDTSVLTPDADNPPSVWVTDNTANNNTIVWDNINGHNYLQLALILRTGTGFTPFPTVNLFGAVPIPNGGQDMRGTQPTNHDPNFGPYRLIVGNANQSSQEPHIWVPLYNPRTGLHGQTWSGTPEIVVPQNTISAAAFPAEYRLWHQNQFVYTQGLRRIMATVSVLGTPSAGRAMLIGWGSS